MKNALPLFLVTILATSCGTAPRNEARMQQTAEQVQIINDGKVTAQSITVQLHNGLQWFPLDPVMWSLDLRGQWDETEQMMGYGFTDPLYRVRANDTQAFSGDRVVTLPEPPTLINGTLHLTEASISALLNAPVSWNPATQSLSLPHLTFENAGDGATTQSNANVNKTEVINYGKQFLGVPYKFGTGPYSANNRTFDCSSFTRHIYGKFGVNLPRSSRSQSDIGQRVTINNLQVGDLMFFYTPGRYSSNKIVGHVGIYAGNNKLLHTYGKPGVVLQEFSPYWRGRFLFGKRL